MRFYISSRQKFKELPGVYLKITKKPDNEYSDKVINLSFYKKGNEFINLPKGVRIIGICFETDNRYYDFSSYYGTTTGFDIRQDIFERDYYIIYKRKQLFQIGTQIVTEFFLDDKKFNFYETKIPDFPGFT